jgi:hypothetical protein
MSAASMKRRLDRLEARRPASEVPPSAAERVTAFLQAKHRKRYERGFKSEPFDRDATLARVRQTAIERGHGPDARY